jgi:uncharacterized protein (TIGR02597 family)
MTVLSLGTCFATILLLLPVSADAQIAATEPEGVVTLPVSAAETVGAKALSFRGLGLSHPLVYQGVASAVSAKADASSELDTLSVANPGWSADQFNGRNGKFYVELIGERGMPGVGTTYDIAATTLTTDSTAQSNIGILWLVQRLADNISSTPMFRIRKHWTLADVFGPNNDQGLAGGTPTTADIIQVHSAGKEFRYYYNNTAGGWREAGNSSINAADIVLYPEDGFVIIRQGRNATKSTRIILGGAVKTGQSSFPIVPGQNVLSNPYAAPMTLGSSNLYTADPRTGLAPGSPTTADLVQIYNGKSYDTYYYSAGGFAGKGWRRFPNGSADASNTVIPMGSSFKVKRINPGAFNWVSPPHPVEF